MINQLELDYQSNRALEINQVSRTPDYIVERYRRTKHWRLFPKEYLFKHIRDIDQSLILDFGCGEGEISVQLAKLGGHITAIDISKELIDIAEERAELDGVQNQIQFIVGNIMESILPDNNFDYVICSGVLHHVDVRLTLYPILKCLKYGGTIIMKEPIAFSPMLQKLRNAIPIKKDISPNEHQLDKSEIDFILENIIDSKVTYFNLFSRLSKLLPSSNRFTKTALIFLNRLDRVLLTIFPYLSRFCGTVVILGQKNKAQ